jgi:Leucine-rich repeat (LRR) protein
MFKGLDLLKELRLKSNGIRQITGLKLSSLVEVDLSRNKITSYDFENLLNTNHQIKVLQIHHNELDKIPFITRSIKINLYKMHASHNNIQVLKNDTFLGYESIKVLNLSFNNIQRIENDAFSSLKYMKILILSHNEIKSIKDINMNNDYQRLDFSWNYLDEIDNKIFYCGYLSFSHNQIQRLPRRSGRNYINTSELYLNSNQIETIEDDAFWNIRVSVLDLSDNKIKLFSFEGSNQLGYLRRLDLSRNEIEVINTKMLSVLKRLIQLNYSCNKIKTIELNSFSNLGLLRVLDLSRNKLDTINETTFAGLIS